MTSRDDEVPPPILRLKDHDAPSVFLPENLLREARRQKGVAATAVPRVCLLDPDGDIVDHLEAAGIGRPAESWVYYHTTLVAFEWDGLELGIIGRAVGAPFATLFVSGCELLVSMTSAGQITAIAPPPYSVAITKALRDEGTSYHYLPPAEYAAIDPGLRAGLDGAFDGLPFPVHWGAAWTTDAPFRETERAIASARRARIAAVEMEAAALYNFSGARAKPVLCLAHVTNTIAVDRGDFEKGEVDGSLASLAVIAAAAKRWLGFEDDGD